MHEGVTACVGGWPQGRDGAVVSLLAPHEAGSVGTITRQLGISIKQNAPIALAFPGLLSCALLPLRKRSRRALPQPVPHHLGRRPHELFLLTAPASDQICPHVLQSRVLASWEKVATGQGANDKTQE